MSKAILMSINPRWCELIARGEKTIEVRKTIPKDLTPPFKVYIYMTAGDASYPVTLNGAPYTCHNNGGKVVIGEFVCKNIYEFISIFDDDWWDISSEELDLACMTGTEFRQYAGSRTAVYGWEISDLVIYERAKSLSEFYSICPEADRSWWNNDKCLECQTPCGEDRRKYLTRPPQSWCYVEEVPHD